MPDDARPLCAGLLSSQSRLLDLVLQSVDLSWCSLDHLFGATPGGCLRRLLLARCRIKGTVPETVAGLRGLVVLDVLSICLVHVPPRGVTGGVFVCFRAV